MTVLGAISAAVAIIGTASGGLVYLNSSYAPRPAFERLAAEFVSYQDNQRLDVLERRLDDYRRNGTCSREPRVCASLAADIRALRRKMGR